MFKNIIIINYLCKKTVDQILIFLFIFCSQKYLEPSPWLQTNFPFKAFQHKLATDTAGPEGE